MSRRRWLRVASKAPALGALGVLALAAAALIQVRVLRLLRCSRLAGTAIDPSTGRRGARRGGGASCRRPRCLLPSVVTSGSCKAYPADGFCAAVGLGGRDVFVYDGATHRTDFAVRDQAIQDFFGPLEIAASSLAGYVFVC